MEWVLSYVNSFWALFLEMAPYLTLGFIFAGLLNSYVNDQALMRWIGQKGFRSVLFASIIGVPMPLCSCGVIPAGLSLKEKGATIGASVSFLISTPQTGVDSILATYAMLGLPLAILRPFIAFVTGIFGGFWVDQTSNDDSKKEASTHKGSVFEAQSKSPFKDMLKFAFGDFLADIFKWLILGLALAAFIDVIIPEEFSSYITQNYWLSMGLALVISVPIYVCATGSIPMAAILLAKGLSPGAALVFLMAGPATNAATFTVMWNKLGKKASLQYLISIVLGALFFGWLIDTALPSAWFSDFATHASHHDHNDQTLPYWIHTLTSVLLITSYLYYLVQTKLTKKNQAHSCESCSVNSNINNETMATLSINVDGMSCNHCKANVEKGLKEFSNVESVNADLSEAKVYIEGKELDKQLLEEKIEALGYVVKS